MKKAKNMDEAWKIQETYEGKPHGWVQWNGTVLRRGKRLYETNR